MPAQSSAFTRAKRLTSARQFAEVFAGADRSSDRFFTVLAAPREAADHARLGLAISRRVAGRAVDRNRLRRLARESFRQLTLAPVDFIVMARADAVRGDNAALRASLERHFIRLSRRAAER